MQISQPRFHHAFLQCLVLGATALPILVMAGDVADIGSRREVFVDRFLIDSMRGVELRLHEPRDEGSVLQFNELWAVSYTHLTLPTNREV